MFRCTRVAGKQSAAAVVVGLLACSLLLIGACTEPVFVSDPTPDAGSDGAKPALDAYVALSPNCVGRACDAGATSGDADGGAGVDETGPEPDASLDATRAKWVGRYATRSTVFSFDDPLKSTGKLLSVAEIVPTAAGGLTLREEMCLYEGAWSFLVNGALRYLFAEAKSETPLSYDADKFESDLVKLQIGYGPTPSGCRAGATAPKEEAWLTGTCDCPRSEDSPPTNTRDCRVIDQEHDGKPGATFTATIATSQISYHATQEERIRLHNGYRLGDRLYADRFFEDTTRVLDCTIGGVVTAAANCPGGLPKPCASHYNKTELVPIAASYSCAQVIAQEQGLFLATTPSFPTACPAELKARAVPAAP